MFLKKKEDFMSIITKEALKQLLEKCITTAMYEVQEGISDPLPAQLYLGLEAFGQQGKELSLDEVLSFLYRDGTFPRIVDIAVRGIRDGRTFIWIRPSGHAYVSDFAQTWNTPVGMGPFKSIISGFLWKPAELLSTQKLKEAGERW
jgi:hypothetical protein